MSKDIYSIVRKRYPELQYALMKEVSDAAGFNRSRSADYIAVSLWPSRGLGVEGIELKSFRSDWLNELKNPKKAEAIFKYCDYFWLLTTDDTIAKLEEIPETWGWLCIKGERITVKKQAPKLTPIAISNNFFAACLKRASDKQQFVHIDSIEDKIKEARQQGIDESKKQIESINKQLLELTTAVDVFNKTSGINLKGDYRWKTSPETIGKTVKFIEDGGVESFKKQLIDLQKVSESINTGIANGLELLNKQNERFTNLT